MLTKRHKGYRVQKKLKQGYKKPQAKKIKQFTDNHTTYKQKA
jgi:hypothetical protein